MALRKGSAHYGRAFTVSKVSGVVAGTGRRVKAHVRPSSWIECTPYVGAANQGLSLFWTRQDRIRPSLADTLVFS